MKECTLTGMKKSELSSTTVYEEGPIASITAMVTEDDEETTLAREVMEEPRTVIPMTMSIVLRVPLDYVTIDLKLEHPDGSSVEITETTNEEEK